MSRLKISPVLVIGVAFSVCLLLVLRVLGIDNSSSTIIGLVSLVATLLIELIFRVGRMEDRLIEAGGLSREMARDEELFEAVSSMVKDYHEVVRRRRHVLFTNRAKDLISECADDLHNLVEGHMVLPPLSQFSFGLKGLEEVEKTLKCTSYVDAHEFWNSVAGEKYLRANMALIDRGVTISRVFIGDRAEMGRLKPIVLRHKDAGVTVSIALTGEAPPDLCEDFLVADNSILVALQLTRDGHARSEIISIDPQEVRRAINRFERLVAGAYQYEQLFPDSKYPRLD